MGTSLQRNRNTKPRPTLTISHRIPSVKMPLGPGSRAVNALWLGKLIPEQGECLGAAGLLPVEVAVGVCHLTQRWQLRLLQRRKEQCPAWQDQQQTVALARWKFTGENARPCYMGEVSRHVYFLKGNLFTKGILCLQRQSTCTQG